MKFGLIAATDQNDLDQYFPMGLASILSVLKERSPEVSGEIFFETDALIEFMPDVVGISCVSQNYQIAKKMAEKIKEILNATVILGGPHISVLPETLSLQFDIGVIGEGEETLVEVLEHLMHPKGDLGNIPGICFHKEGKIIINSHRGRIENLDTLPSLIPAINRKMDHIHMITSRGCPYRCSFCSARKIWGDFKAQSPQRVIDDLQRLVNRFDFKKVHIFDDLFIADKKRFEQFALLFEKWGLKEKIELSLTVRADLVDNSLCSILNSIGVKEVTFGAESSDERVLKTIKPGLSLKDNDRALKLLSKYGIDASISMIVGFPGQSEDSMRDTYRFIAGHILGGRLVDAEVHLLAPFPGTSYFDMAKERGLFKDNIDWSNFGRPWRGLVLNDDLNKIGAELVSYDKQMRKLFRLLRGPSVAVVTGNYDEKRLREISLFHNFSAVYGTGKEISPAVYQRGEPDIACMNGYDIYKNISLLSDVPIFVIDGNALMTTGFLRGALSRYFAGAKGKMSMGNSLRVLRNDIFTADLFKENANMGENCEIEFDDHLDLLKGGKVDKKSFTQIFDEHSLWIADLRKGVI